LTCRGAVTDNPRAFHRLEVAMAFRESLERIVGGTPGALGGVIMAMDGIAVDSYAHNDDVDMVLYGAEIAALLRQLRGAGAISLSSGPVDELHLFARKFHGIVRFLSDEYFVALAVRPGGQVGKARYLLRAAIPDLVSEL
jgi:predicted regulator of Ras-like GTPase activity (Roadblock/LC7/MglB family)